MRIKMFRGIVVIFLILMLLQNLCYSKKKKKPEKNIYIEMIKPEASEIVIFTKKGVTTYPLFFRDDLIEIGFECVGSKRHIEKIPFTLLNKTSLPIKLIWDESIYIDPDKTSHKLLPLAEIEYIERNKKIEEDISYPTDLRYKTDIKDIGRDKQIPATIIAPNSKIENIIYPSDYVKWRSRDEYNLGELILKGGVSIGEWVLNPIFRDLQKQLEKLEILNFGVFMMLEIDGERKGYNFLFEITNSSDLFSTFEEKEEKKE